MIGQVCNQIKHRQYQFNTRISMDSQFQCTKIKDALYLGSLASTQDFQFLQTNKFSYIVNCSAQIPNYFDNHNIKYLKFKLIRQRSHKLWDQNLKKLRKLQKFIEEAQQQSLCCIIFSAGGNNRSLVMLTAYLMSRYRWTLSKAFEYIKSKKIFIGLTQHYIAQLQLLQSLLSKEEDKPKLTSTWKQPYQNEQEEIISKTYVNSQQIPILQPQKKEKKEKRVTWQDKIDKEKKKEGREGKLRQTGVEQFKKIKSSHKLIEDSINSQNSLSTKILKNASNQSPLKKPENMKKPKRAAKNVSINKMQTICQQKEGKDNFIEFDQQSDKPQFSQPLKKIEENRFFSEKELLKLIKKNLKLKKEDNIKIQGNNQENEPLAEKGIYKLTINNFIAPNINIMNPLTDKTSEKLLKNNSKVIKKDDKNGRTLSQKESLKANQSIKGKPDKNKSYKRNTENSPKAKQRKLQKAVSLQFKKNN